MIVSPDADLIFLAMATHNPNVWIFRENIFDDIPGDFFLVEIEKFKNCMLGRVKRELKSYER